MCVRAYVCMFSIFLIFFIFHSIRTFLIVISRSLSHTYTHTHTCIQNCAAQIKFFAVCVAAAALSTFRFVFLSCCVCSPMQKETEEIFITYTFLYSNHNACVESFVIIVIVACNIKDTFCCCIFKTKKCEMVKNRKRRRHDVRAYNQCDRTQTT